MRRVLGAERDRTGSSASEALCRLCRKKDCASNVVQIQVLGANPEEVCCPGTVPFVHRRHTVLSET